MRRRNLSMAQRRRRKHLQREPLHEMRRRHVPEDHIRRVAESRKRLAAKRFLRPLLLAKGQTNMANAILDLNTPILVDMCRKWRPVALELWGSK